MAGKVLTVVAGGVAYKYVPGTSFISVWPDTIKQKKTPLDMVEIPPWVVRSAVDSEVVLRAVLAGISEQQLLTRNLKE